MRPFEADRRVYLVFGADSLNEDAADALLKDLEEPPPYAVVVLVAERLGPLSETIRSRCQLVPSGVSRSPPCGRRSRSMHRTSARKR
jgi:DNA polymerase-3 subunit delta'